QRGRIASLEVLKDSKQEMEHVFLLMGTPNAPRFSFRNFLINSESDKQVAQLMVQYLTALKDWKNRENLQLPSGATLKHKMAKIADITADASAGPIQKLIDKLNTQIDTAEKTIAARPEIKKTTATEPT